jgi:hypothetical protein
MHFSIKDRFFEEKNQEFPPPKVVGSKYKYGSKYKWLHQKVLLESFPMNGHVGMFRQSYILGNFCGTPPLVTEVTISP